MESKEALQRDAFYHATKRQCFGVNNIFLRLTKDSQIHQKRRDSVW